LTAWDLFLDPQMVAEGFWRWTRPGRYRGVPLTNFGGWFAAGVAVMAILDRVLPPDDPAPDLVAEYAVMAAMETVGFAAFFRDGVVAVVGGLTMLPIAVASVARLVGHRP
jgi:putative membrane protein